MLKLRKFSLVCTVPIIALLSACDGETHNIKTGHALLDNDTAAIKAITARCDHQAINFGSGKPGNWKSFVTYVPWKTGSSDLDFLQELQIWNGRGIPNGVDLGLVNITTSNTDSDEEISTWGKTVYGLVSATTPEESNGDICFGADIEWPHDYIIGYNMAETFNTTIDTYHLNVLSYDDSDIKL